MLAYFRDKMLQRTSPLFNELIIEERLFHKRNLPFPGFVGQTRWTYLEFSLDLRPEPFEIAEAPAHTELLDCEDRKSGLCSNQIVGVFLGALGVVLRISDLDLD